MLDRCAHIKRNPLYYSLCQMSFQSINVHSRNIQQLYFRDEISRDLTQGIPLEFVTYYSTSSRNRFFFVQLISQPRRQKTMIDKMHTMDKNTLRKIYRYICCSVEASLVRLQSHQCTCNHTKYLVYTKE